MLTDLVNSLLQKQKQICSEDKKTVRRHFWKFVCYDFIDESLKTRKIAATLLRSLVTILEFEIVDKKDQFA